MKDKLLTHNSQQACPENPRFKLFMQGIVQNFDFHTKIVPCGTLDVPCGLVHQLTVKFLKEHRTALQVYRAVQRECRAVLLATQQFEILDFRYV
jgi:hypothetical protein